MTMTINNKIKLDESLGEVICSECEGSKSVNKGVYGNVPCDKCDGTGKVDWISQVMLPPPHIQLKAGWSFSTEYEMPANPSLHNDTIDAMAKSLAAKIDRDIMDKIINVSNKI